ncbi:MAG: TonB-dependent receptor [Sphingomicrobium sp.]
MTDSKLRVLNLGLLASTILASAAAPPALAQTASDSPAPATNATNVTGKTPQEQVANDGQAPDTNEIIVTAQKRQENVQNVPISIQAIGSRRLDQLNISNFEQYTKQLPSVSFQTSQPGQTVVYMRGVASGGDGNHSGSLPSVGTYLDEQPVTTIGGTLDVHIYDIARIESLAGPQGTLYGASSQAGTIRIITNKPELGITVGRVDGELNKVEHGDMGGSLEGMINLPVATNVAFRGVAFYQRDAGFIDNVHASRTYCGDPVTVPDPDSPGDDLTVGCFLNGVTVDNDEFVKKDFNDQRTYGGRAALKIELDDNWTVTPTVIHQNMKSNGWYGVDPDLGDLKTDRFRDEVRKDKFTQAALTVEGKIGNFDLTYAGAYLDRKDYQLSDYTDYADAYDQLYVDYGGIANYFAFQDEAGQTIDPRQFIVATDHFKKFSNEVRIGSPVDRPLRLLAGAFMQRQSNDIFQDYKVDNLGPLVSVNGNPGTLWLTKQDRVDRDYAVFGDLSYDITPKITLSAGGRLFWFNNSLFGFFGFGRNPAYFQDAEDNPPPNAAYSSYTGVGGCYTVTGATLRQAQLDGTDTTLITNNAISGTPCTNLAEFDDGKLVPKRKKGSGFTHRLNGQYKPNEDLMFYATWSRGFRPGGINRRASVESYDPDYLSNYEIGWKSTLAGGAIRWNGAIYHQLWKKFQYSFLGLNSFTEIHNGSDAKINGIETDVSYTGDGLTLNAAAAYTDAKTKNNICFFDTDVADCSDVSADDYPNFVAASEGTRLPVTPKFKASATARYTWLLSGYKTHVQAAISYQGSARASLRDQALFVPYWFDDRVDPNDILGRIKSSTLVDLAAGMDFNRFSLELFTTNLFDERNELTRYAACSSCLRGLMVPGRPRTIGIRAGARF